MRNSKEMVLLCGMNMGRVLRDNVREVTGG